MKHRIKTATNLLDAILEAYHGVSKQKAKQIVSHGSFLLNGTRISNHPKNEVKIGDLLEIENGQKKPAPEVKNPDKRNPVSIQFEDEYFVIGIKPAGLLTNPDPNQQTAKSFQKLLENYLNVRENKPVKLYVVHRLDREVEGIVMFTKDEELRDSMKDNWSEVTKIYTAITERRPSTDEGIIENWLMDTPSQKVMAFRNEVAGSKYAKSSFRFVKQLRKYSLIEVKLHSGRKNQIRVHLSGIGCPIVGDRKYGADSSFIRQIRLAATYLEFNHPVYGKNITIAYQPNKRFFNPAENEDEKYKII
jgi:23S rRNA pseudouridine1911/1915/1917 synthase